MDRRWNLLFIIPLLTALVAFFLTDEILYTGLGFVVGYLVMEGARHLLLPPNLHKAVQRFQAGELEESLELANQAIAARPQRWESYYLRALIYFALSNLEEAEMDARKAIDLKPDNDTSHVTLGQILYSQAKFEQAEEAFAEAVRLRGKEGLNQYHLAATHYRLDRCEQAAPRLELATRLGIDNEQLTVLAFYYLGRCNERLDQPEEAAAAYAELDERRDAFESLKRDLGQAPAYPALDLMRQDVAAIEHRLRRP